MGAIAKEQIQIELSAEDKSSAAFNVLKSHLLDTQKHLGTLRSLLSGLNAGDARGIAGIFTGMAGAAGAAGAAFAVVVTGIEAATVATEALYKALSTPARTTEQILQEQARLIDVIKKGYSETATEVDKYAASLSALTLVQERASNREAQQRVNMQTSAAIGQMGFMTPSTMFGMPGLEMNQMAGDFQVAPEFKAFAGAIADLQAGLARGQPDVARFREEIAQIALAAPGLEETRAKLDALVATIANLDPTKLTKTREELERTKQIGAEKGFTDAFKALLEMAPSANEAELRANKIMDAYRKAAEAIEAIKKSDALSSSAPQLIAQVQSALKSAIDEINKESPDRFDNLATQIQHNIEELELQEQTAGRSGAALTKLKTEHELLRAAMKAEREITPELRAEIEKLAGSYATMTENVARAKLIGDARFDREQLGRSSIDQTIASRLRGAGLEVDFGSAEADLIRFNEQLKTTVQLGQDFASGFMSEFRSAMKSGADAGTAALTALNNQLDRLIDKLIDMAVKDLVGQALGVGLGGSLFGGGAGAMGGTGPQVFMGGAGSNPWMSGTAWGSVSANGNIFHGGNVIPFARGGIVNRPTVFPMANGAGLMGEAGPEAVMPLRRGPGGRLGVEMHGGGGGNKVIINNYGAQVEEPRENDDGDLEFTVRALARDEFASGRMNGIMRSKHGVAPRGTPRG